MQRWDTQSETWVNLNYTTTVTEGTLTRYKYRLTIPAWQVKVQLRLVPRFDWSDEGVLFDPTTAADPKSDIGEWANLEIREVDWGWKNIWDAKGETDAKIEIKDGAICLITTDSNNDGTIDVADNDPKWKNSADYPGRMLKINDDDDNKNSLVDSGERPPLFAEPRNRMPAVFEQDHKTYDNENDLAEAKLYVWIDDLTCTLPDKEIIIDIYCNAPENLVMWDMRQKGKHLHYVGYRPHQGRVPFQKTLETLSSNNLTFTKTVYMEATGAVSGPLVLSADTVIIHACHSNGSAAEGLVSEDGIFHGETGGYYPVHIERIVKLWGRKFVSALPEISLYEYGGKQKTNPFEVYE